MLLSVITLDNQPGMQRMLEKELEGLDAEIINKSFDKGLKQAKGDFVCFLEPGSGIKAGSIKSNLTVFTEKPAYRKLAMVSPKFDLPSRDIKTEVWLSYHDGLTVNNGYRSGKNPTRIGMFLGAIIRTSSLKKSKLLLNNDPLIISNMLSNYFWENGLRIHLNTEAVYEGAENVEYSYKRPFSLPLVPSDKVCQIWQQEMIS